MTEPTDAELDELRQANSGRLNFVTLSEFRTIARAALAKWGAQPVPSGAAEFALQALVAAGHVTQERVDQALVLPGAPAQPVVPAGYALVPVEPTPEMLSEIWVHKNGSLSEAYRAMLAAAPRPTQAQTDTPCRKNPFYHGPRNCIRGTVGCCEDHGTATQAQAGAVPLTDEQIEALPMWKRFVGLWPETRREIVRIIESAHGIGIKGGQHGADTRPN